MSQAAFCLVFWTERCAQLRGLGPVLLLSTRALYSSQGIALFLLFGLTPEFEHALSRPLRKLCGGAGQSQHAWVEMVRKMAHAHHTATEYAHYTTRVASSRQRPDKATGHFLS